MAPGLGGLPVGCVMQTPFASPAWALLGSAIPCGDCHESGPDPEGKSARSTIIGHG